MKPYLKFKKWRAQKKGSDLAYLTVEVTELAQEMVDSLFELCQKSPKDVHWKKHSKRHTKWRHRMDGGSDKELQAALSSIFAQGHETIYWEAFLRLLNQITPPCVWVSGKNSLLLAEVKMQFISSPDKASKELVLFNT